MRAFRKRFAGASALAVVASGLLLVPAAPAQANPAGTGLVISEVYGAGGNSGAAYNNDFIELYNPTNADISVAGWAVQYFSAGGGSGGTVNLTGSVPAQRHYLVQLAPGTTVTNKPLPGAGDVAGNINMGSGRVFLLNTTTALANAGTGAVTPGTGAYTTVVDMVGAASNAASYEGTGPATTTTGAGFSIQRVAPSFTDTDNNAADFVSTLAPTPVNSTGNATSEPLAVTDPGAKSGFVGTAISPITLAATGGKAPYTWQASGLPDGLSLTGATISGTPTATGASEVTVTATDSATPTAATASKTFTITVSEELQLKTIAEIQGTGARSPFAPATGNGTGTDVVSTEGVVTARYATGGLNGMYIQTPGADTEGASDGIFVYAGSANANIPAGIDVGDSVRVTGRIAEFYDLTQIVPAFAGAVTELGTSLGTVTPRSIAYPATDAGREVREGELLAPTGDFTVTNSYSLNQYAAIGLATGTTPLRQMTEYAAPKDMGAINAIKADNLARGVVLDDGQTTDFMQDQANKAIPLPWLTPNNPIRVGAAATFTGPVVLDWRNSVWKFQPTLPVTGNGADVATFEDTRADNLAPANVGGDLKIATFNVLNYFNTTGEAYVAAGPLQSPPIETHCAYYTDRESNRIGNDQCGVKQPGETYTSSNPNDGRGPRGAATAVSLARQEAKLAHTINALNADVIALEEVENSIKLPGETNRDDALARIVQILNDAAGETKWAYVKSPGVALTAAAVAEQDTIRPAFIYKTASVSPVGQSDILFGTTQFANAREPLAQAFKAKGAPDSDAFAVIVNHFKSKGDNPKGVPAATGDNANDTETGVGAFNGDRVRQAQRLLQFADDFAKERDLTAIFLAGDFNSYTMEEPIQVLEEGHYELVESDDPDDESYSYSGLSGSLDHVLANAAAMDMVTGADIWEINADESPAFQYSRFNYNATDFWQPNLPFATSDHNPEIVGIDVPEVTPTSYREIQVLGTNDFHGRLLPDGGNAAGAAPFATAVKELKTENPNSIFVAAGDLVGASTFESFIQDDKPTIDALNAMGLEVSAAGNHEFDRGYEDLVGRIQGLADWEYIAANVQEPAGRDDLAETFTKTIDGVQVGFVGAVTEDLPALVAPAGIKGVTVTDVVDATNAAAAELKADGADLVVLLVHEGSPTTQCSSTSFTDKATTWGNIVQNASADVDAIISGHTHLAYNCRFPVKDWADDGRAVTKRPVVSAGQYGTNLNKLVFKYDVATEALAAITQDVVATAGIGYAPDPEVKGIVDAAVAFADTAGAKGLGKMNGPFRRASYLPKGQATENRGGESTLSNQVAEVQRWATDTAGIPTDIAFMNPGGLRADMTGTVNGALRDLSYREAADVQPFANTLVNMRLTGAQLEKVLEQQWQRNAQGGVPSRPFLRLGISKGFTYTYLETPEKVTVPNSAPVDTFKGEVTGMWLNGRAIRPDRTYSVTVNSFLGGGGDNFWELANGAAKVDTGKVDLQAMVDYMKRYDAEHPLPVDYGQRAVEVTFPAGAPQTYAAGASVRFDVGSWAMSAAGDLRDSQIDVRYGDTSLGTATVDNTIGGEAYDSYGTAAVTVTLPADITDGTKRLMLVGAQTGTRIPVPIRVEGGVEEIQILATNDFHGRLTRSPSSAEAGAAVLAGAVDQLREENANTVFAAAGDLIGASTFESFIQDDEPTIDALNAAGLEVSSVGNHEFDQGYADLVGRVQDRAEWQYIGANVRLKSNDSHAVPASWIKDFGDVEVGFVGAVTEELPSLVTPSGIADIKVTGIVEEANAAADALRTAGADIVVLLVHEGATTTNVTAATDDSAFGRIVKGVDGDIDAIVSGHTHLAYNHAIPVQEWIDEGRAVTARPVVSAGQYGYNLNQLEFSYDPRTDKVVGLEQNLLALQSCTVGCTSSSQTWTANYQPDPAVTTLVTDAVKKADVLGAAPLGELGGAFNRAKLFSGGENRGGESTLGNLVAEVQRWATETPEAGAAQIAFMNPGGLRQDMVGSGTGAFPRTLTYKQAAVVQPFANTLVNMDLTGANIKAALEQQWQPAGASRPFLRLGVSEGFTYTYSAGLPAGSRITGMWLNGQPIDLEATYSVTVNSFLATGGDNFGAFKNGTRNADTGKVDLQAMVDYLAAFAAESPLAVDYTQRSVGVSFPESAPNYYEPGDHVRFGLSSLAFSTPADLKDDQVRVSLGDQVLGTFTVDNTIGTDVTDEYGTASVDFVLPRGLGDGVKTLTVRGLQTGTKVPVAIEVVDTAPPVEATTTTATAGPMRYGTAGTVRVTVTPATASGAVTVTEGDTTVASGTVTNGSGIVTIGGTALEPGSHTLTVRYAGDATHQASQGTVSVEVAKAETELSATAPAVDYAADATVAVTVEPRAATGPVTVSVAGEELGSGTLADGTASITIAGGRLEPGSHVLSVAYAGDARHAGASTTLTLEVRKAASTTSATVSPPRLEVGSGKASITVTVAAGGADPAGTVTAVAGGKVLASGVLVRGRAVLKVGPFDTAGVKAIEVRYAGSDRVSASATTTSVRVVKADASVSASHTPGVVKAGKTRARLTVRVKAAGLTPTGWVTVNVPGQGSSRVRLVGGRATLRLAKFAKPGARTVTVSYQGSDKVESARTQHVIRVVKK